MILEKGLTLIFVFVSFVSRIWGKKIIFIFYDLKLKLKSVI